MRKRHWIISPVLVACWLMVTPVLAESPTAYVRGILDQVLAVQNAPALTDAARARSIHRVIQQNFDFTWMARDALGSAFGGLAAAQRRDFTDTFSYLFQDSYTRMVLKFLKRETIQYGQERQQGDKARVDTVIARANESIPVTYLMHAASQGWILYDVSVDGVSILENYRTQFAQVIRTKSFDFLLERMKQQRRGIE